VNDSLERTQSWMYDAITRPFGSPSPSCTLTVAPSVSLTSEQRLAIYHRSYYARLLECMDSMFPALRHALGAELFRHFAAGYLQANPPESYTLNRLADRFPDYLAATRPATGPSGERETWPDFVIELATLELAAIHVFDGPGIEGQPLPMESVTPKLAPCVRLFAFEYPAHRYWNSYLHADAPELPDPKPSFVVMTRRDYRVRTLEIPLPQYEVLQKLDGQTSMATLAETSLGLDESILAGWIAEWASLGLLTALGASSSPLT